MTEPAPPSVAELEEQLANARAAAAKAAEGEPVPVAEQKAAGVPPAETVTIAEQKAGTDPPDLEALAAEAAAAAADEPVEPDATPIIPQLRAGGGTSNEAPMLPPSATTGAARAHALLDHALAALPGDDPAAVEAIIRRAQDELDRYLPAPVKAAAIPEAAQVMAAGL